MDKELLLKESLRDVLNSIRKSKYFTGINKVTVTYAKYLKAIEYGNLQEAETYIHAMVEYVILLEESQVDTSSLSLE